MIYLITHAKYKSQYRVFLTPYKLMKLQLEKPLIVFDLETTGINISKDRIVELFFLKINADGTEEELHKRINPTIPIPKESSEIHGIYDEDVRHAPTFKEVAQELYAFVGKADFGGFNSNRFDFPMLVEEFYRVDIDLDIEGRRFVDAQRIFHTMEPRNLSAAYKFYCSKELANAHSAAADTKATWEIIKAQVNRYDELQPDISFLHKFSGQGNLVDLAGRIKRNPNGDPVFAFGKHKGKTLVDVYKKEPGYFEWIKNGDFPENTKRTIGKIILKHKMETGL
jgi:DNA polymerase-3 subunit epsilon